MSSSSSKYWFMRIPKYHSLSENLILVLERKIEGGEYTLILLKEKHHQQSS